MNTVPAAARIALYSACSPLSYRDTVHCRVTYTPCKISQVELNSPYLRDVFMQYWASGNPDPKCPFLSIYNKGKEDRIALHVEDQQALVMGLGNRDCVAGCGWGASSDEDEVVVLTVEDRELREKALEAECTAALKRWVAYGRDLDFTPYLKERVTEHAAGKVPDIVVLDADVSAMEQKNYDLMGDLLEADILMLFRQVLRQEESLVKVGGQAQFGYLPRMTLANIGAMNAESFCERILSCASLVVTDLHTSLDHEEVRMLTMLRMNKSLMEYMRKEYDNLHSHIEASETRITKQLRDKAEVQAQEAATMDEEY